MADATKIIIKQEYFDNIKVAIDSLNTFFGSNFKTKNFPMLDSNDQLDGTMMSILSWMNNVDPSLVENTEQMNQVIDKINDMNESADGDLLTKLTNDNDERGLDMINAVIGHKMLQYIADHFESFSKLMNGIYTFELFTKPKEYESVINVFSKPIPMDEIEDALGDNKYQILNEEKYIHGVFENPQITLPKSMKEENEVSRFDHGTDLENVEVLVDDTVQEAAEINYFVEMKPEHLRYHPSLKCVQISKQFEAKVNQLVSGLRGCNTTEDLKQYFNNFPFSPDDFSHVVIPCILVRVFASTRKFPNQSYDKAALKKYTDSYKSILSQNKGANRFAAYDLFSTFKADKEGTIKFIEDFMKLRLVNDESGAISNNTLLTLFNIFDSRIYLDIMYNMLPDNVKNSVAPSEDAFVKHVRAKINKNSRNGNIYKKDTSVPSDSTVKTSEEVVEYVSNQFNDVTLTMEDMRYCENYQSLVYDEINTIGDALYNEGVSPEELVSYIGESFTLFDPPKTYQEGLFTKIKDHFAQKKLKKIHDLETSIGVTFSPEYIDVLMGKLKLREYMTSDLEICVIFHKLNGATKTGIKKGMVDLQRYDVDKGVDKSKLYPIGRLMFSQRLPMYELPIIASDTEGNVYVTCDKSNINKLVKFSSSIKEFVRNIHRQAFEVESREYTLSNCYNLNGNAYDVEVRLQAKYLYPEALLYETYYCKNNGESFRWLLDYAVYPALDEYFGKKFGVEKTSKTMYDEDGNPVTITTGGFDSTKALACIQRILIADDYNHQHFKLFFAFVFDKHDKPAVMVELDGEDIVRIEMMQGMPNQNNITSRMPRDMKSLSGFDAKNALSIDKSIQNDTKKYDEPVQESDEIDVDHDFIQESFLGKLFEKHNQKKQRKALESEIAKIESQHNVKLSEEYKNIVMNDPNYPNDKNACYSIITPNEMSFTFVDKAFDSPEGKYPVIKTEFEYDFDYKNNRQMCETLYSDADGNIYGAIYNKNMKFEKVASSIKDFFENVANKNIYWKIGDAENSVFVYYDNNDEEIEVDIVIKHDADGRVHPTTAAFITLCDGNDAFGEIVRDKIYPEMEKTLGDTYTILKAVFDENGVMDLIINYNGKKTSLRSLNVSWKQDYHMEAADVDGSIPDYMKTRIDLSDGDENSEPKEPVVTDVQLPPDIPANDFDDLGNSIDERLDTETDKLDQVLGSGYQGEISKQGGEGKVVYNITYNYNNSYNTSNSNNTSNSHNTTQTNSHNTTNDSSSNKQVTSNSNNSTSKKVVTNSHNVSPTRHRGSNNNNNSTVLSDTKDSNATDTSKKDTFSTGKSIQEVFAFLESEEPLSDTMNAKPPKEDLLTKAMDNDRKTLSKQQSLKKGLQKIGNTARAIVKPIGRTKQWLTNMVNSLIKRDEDKVKASLIENPSYRSAVFKAGRIALKLGLFATFAYINPWYGAIYAGAEGLKLADRNRLRKEVQDEFATELKIMDEKIEQAKHKLAYGNNDPKTEQELYKLMRQRDKMQQMAPQSMKSYIKRAADF